MLEDRWPAVIAASPSIALQYSKEDIGFTSGALSEPLVFKPYSGLVDQRTAIYFPHFTPEQWPIERRRRDAVAAVREAKSQATIDRLEVGDSADETAHHMQESRTELTPYRGLNGRRLKPGGFYSAQMQIAGERAAVYVTYWGEATRGRVAIIVDGEQIGEQVLEANNPGDFFEGEYLIPAKYLVGRDRITLRFEAQPDTRAPSIYGLRIALPTS